jgi:predicted AAA+ superfamily ATPase
LITGSSSVCPTQKKQYGTEKRSIRSIPYENQIAFRISGDQEILLENLVLIELKRRGFDVYYHFSAKECDFVIIQNGKVNALYQVCSELTDMNREREYDGLQEAMKQYGLDWGMVITMSQEGAVRVPEGVIQIMPMWKWL